MDRYIKLERKLYEYPSNKLRLYSIEIWLNSYHNKESITVDEHLHYLKQSRLKRELKEEIISIECSIKFLNPKEKEFIRLKYFDMKSIQEIIIIMDSSSSRIYALKNKVLNKVLKESI